MAKAQDKSLPPVIKDMLQKPQQYSFEQVISLLYLWKRSHENESLFAFLQKSLRFRPDLSLSFAVSDIHNIKIQKNTEQKKSPQKTQDDPVCKLPDEQNDWGKAHITATFLGLYGTSSPLPKFYTERLFDEQSHDSSSNRDFLDIFNNQFYMLHALLQNSINPWHSWCHPLGRQHHMLMSLASFGSKSLYDKLFDNSLFLQNAGLFFQQARPASGLINILNNVANWQKIRLHQNKKRMAKIPKDQILCLGESSASLGEDSTIGTHVPCYEDSFEIEIYDVDLQTFYTFLPKNTLAQKLHTLIKHYNRKIVNYFVTIKLLPNQAKALCLGGLETTTPYGNENNKNFATLGHDTWLGYGGNENTLKKATAHYHQGFKNM